MQIRHPEFAPDPSLSRKEMESLQNELADVAVFEDEFAFDPDLVRLDGPLTDGSLTDGQTTLDGTNDGPVIVGVDQAFLDDRAVSAIVAIQDGVVVERVAAVTDVEIPYIPGLLSFREGGAMLAAFEKLTVEPDLALLDGSGRIHFRQAGIATHIGVMFDLPTVGVAKSLLCGNPRSSLDDPLPEGTRVPIEADGRVTAPAGTVIGYAVQSRQYDSGSRYINPLYVSPGHRVSAETAADFAERLSTGYKLPEPTRRADSYADEIKREFEGHD